MWARIEEARKSHAADAHAPLAAIPMRRGRMWVWPTAGVAAALLVAAGIVIGRRMERSATNRPSTVAQTSPDRTASDSTAITAATHVPSATSTVVAALPVNSATAKKTRAEAEVHGPSTNFAYRLAVLQHLAGTEAMITSFR
jgi:hypothetical protein